MSRDRFDAASSDEIWAAFEATQNPQLDVWWKSKLEEAEMKAKHAEDLYRNALAQGLPPAVTTHLAMEVTYAKRAIEDLHDERIRRERNE